MGQHALRIMFTLVVALTAGCQAVQAESPVLKGPYLGQKPPGRTPEVFAPGIVSTGAHEFAGSFTPDGKYLFFSGGQRGKGDIYWVSAEALGLPEPAR
jgi:hypothetical protein